MNDAKKDYHAPMHSVEHILNQTMVRMFDCGRSFGSHIERKKSKCDYRMTRNLTDDELKTIEDKVNEIIMRNLDVRESFIDRKEALERFDLRRLPEDVGDTVRIIEIGDYDACPCIGAHVNNTSETGDFKIISSNFADGVLRIRYKLIDKDLS